MGVNLTIQNPQVFGGAGGIPTETNLTGPFNLAWHTFVDGDTTPDISAGTFFNTANTGATSISDFDGNTNCLISVKAGDDDTTIEHDPTKIFLLGGLDITLLTGDIKWFANDSGVWYELPNP